MKSRGKNATKSYTFDDVAAADLGCKPRIAFNRRAINARVGIRINWVVLGKSDRPNDRVHWNHVVLVEGNTCRDRTWGQSNIVANEAPR